MQELGCLQKQQFRRISRSDLLKYVRSALASQLVTPKGNWRTSVPSSISAKTTTKKGSVNGGLTCEVASGARPSALIRMNDM